MNNTFWDFLGLSNREVLLSGVIGWLLNPKGDHGLGDTFLKNVLKKVGESCSKSLNVVVEPKDKSRNRFDILVETDRPLVFEVKCKTYGYAKQLQKYSSEDNKVVRIGYNEWNFPDLDARQRKCYPLITFQEIAKIIEEISNKTPKYKDFLISFKDHLIKETKAFDHIHKYYITEEVNNPPSARYSNKGNSFINQLYWNWLIEESRNRKENPIVSAGT